MADWTDIPDENLLPGRPARSIDAIALRDNVTAQAEGATGAPKSQTDSYGDETITVEKMARYTGSPSKEIYRSRSGASTTGSSDCCHTFFCTPGQYRLAVNVDSTTDKRTQIFVNGAQVYLIEDLAGPITRSATFTVNQGDNAFVRISNINQPGTATVTGYSIYHEKVVPVNGE